MPLKVCHVVPGLHAAGAELMAYRLMKYWSQQGDRFDFSVISLFHDGPVRRKLEALSIPTHLLSISKNSPRLAAGLWSLYGLMRRLQPDVVQTWTYHGDLLGGFAARAATKARVVWNIRHSTLDPEIETQTILRSARLGSWFSKIVPDSIVLNSHSAMQTHIDFGYYDAGMRVIPNGFDLDLFRPSQRHRVEVRRELGLHPKTPLVGLLARFHVDKNHKSFVEGARIIHARVPEAHFVCAGLNITWENKLLVDWIDDAGLRSRFHLLDIRADAHRLQSAFDVGVCCSRTEAFPNVVGEAMACGVPCVVTDVGDCARLVGDTGVIIEAGDTVALAAGIGKLLLENAAGRARRAAEARSIMESRYSLSVVSETYGELWAEGR